MHLATPARSMKSFRKLRAILLTPVLIILGLTAATSAVAENCEHVNAYWHTNMEKLVENIQSCDDSSWQHCSEAAAIHFDLLSGSLGQRAASCGINTPAVPGHDYTRPLSSDTASCQKARDNLRDIFETRALARLACAAAREGAADNSTDQDWLDSQCQLYRSQMSNYHLSFRKVTQQCELDDYSNQVATVTFTTDS